MNSQLTKPQRRVIDALKREGGPISTGYLFEYAGVTRAGLVCRNLEKKGLVTFGGWWDEEHGHDVQLTEAGKLA